MIKQLEKDDIKLALLLLNKGAKEPWDIIDGKLTRAFKFKNFSCAFAFMTQVAILSERADHHPEWSNIYNKVNIQLITHEAKGLTLRDFNLAQEINKL